jgi:hypothetical protein
LFSPVIISQNADKKSAERSWKKRNELIEILILKYLEAKGKL